MVSSLGMPQRPQNTHQLQHHKGHRRSTIHECNLTSLSLHMLKQAGPGMMALAKALKTNETIQQLQLWTSNDDSDGDRSFLSSMANALSHNSTLHELTIHQYSDVDPIDEEKFAALEAYRTTYSAGERIYSAKGSPSGGECWRRQPVHEGSQLRWLRS